MTTKENATQWQEQATTPEAQGLTLKRAQETVAVFTGERGWDVNMPTQRICHAQRELARLSEHTMFMEGMTARKPTSNMEKLVGDAMFSVLALANCLRVDVEEQLTRAMAEDAVKYPPAQSKADSLQRLAAARRFYDVDRAIENLTL